MIISEEQVRRAVEYLQTAESDTPSGVSRPGETVETELLAKVRDVLSLTPDLRVDRIEHAKALLAGSGPSGAEVADKIIGREISDSLR
ncbi:MAG: hypothetical protein OEV43_02650 [Coriobacteriia bacterium]|nr:hypothetical protein [Coriobacteriia bacterium]